MFARIEPLNIKVLHEHKIALRELARQEGESMSVVLRQLIRQAAESKGAWPTDNPATLAGNDASLVKKG